MPTYRVLRPTDLPALTAFWDVKGRPQLEGFGYVTFPLEPGVLAHPRTIWAGAFDNSGNLRGVIEAIVARGDPRTLDIGRFAIDPAISLAQVRAHRNEVARLVWNRVPDNWTIRIKHVRQECIIAREYCDARFRIIEDEYEERHYSDTAARMKAVA